MFLRVNCIQVDCCFNVFLSKSMKILLKFTSRLIMSLDTCCYNNMLTCILENCLKTVLSLLTGRSRTHILMRASEHTFLGYSKDWGFIFILTDCILKNLFIW